MIGTDYDKELRKKLIKSIKIKHNKKWFNYIDKIFKIQKIKIKNMHLEDDNKTNKFYRVEYTYDFNKINPVSWIFIILLFMSKVIETIVECIGEFRDTERQTYTGTFKIKKKEMEDNYMDKTIIILTIILMITLVLTSKFYLKIGNLEIANSKSILEYILQFLHII